MTLLFHVHFVHPEDPSVLPPNDSPHAENIGAYHIRARADLQRAPVLETCPVQESRGQNVPNSSRMFKGSLYYPLALFFHLPTQTSCTFLGGKAEIPSKLPHTFVASKFDPPQKTKTNFTTP